MWVKSFSASLSKSGATITSVNNFRISLAVDFDKGLLKEVYVWDIVLTEKEIKDIGHNPILYDNYANIQENAPHDQNSDILTVKIWIFFVWKI